LQLKPDPWDSGSSFVTLFEYLSVAASIVLALGVGRLISSIRSVFSPNRRDWLHASFVVLLVLLHLFQWWRLWPLHDVSTWNFLQFLIVIGSPICLYFAAQVLVSDFPAGVESWQDHFADAHRWFFAAIACNVFFGILRVLFVLDLEAQPLLMASYLAGPIAGCLLSNRAALAAVGVLAWVQTAYLIHRSFVAGPYPV
jgi:hypothetical protein